MATIKTEKRSFTISLKYEAEVQVDHRSQNEREKDAEAKFKQEAGALLMSGRATIIDTEENDPE
jgi:hypothetical protein